jgi:hypothetical protein
MVDPIEVPSDGMTPSKFHDDHFGNSSNIKDITSTMIGCSDDTTDDRG